MTVNLNIGLGTQAHHNISGSFYFLLKIYQHFFLFSTIKKLNLNTYFVNLQVSVKLIDCEKPLFTFIKSLAFKKKNLQNKKKCVCLCFENQLDTFL